MALTVELVAADRKVWSGDATRVVARTTDGEIGILPGHAPLLGVLVEGEVRISGEGEQVTARVDGGFLSVDHDRVTIVAERAEVGAGSSN
ncbi:F0F1 ATP synthase subunit epsilon [Angustibacter sp. Root456]|uniref:F0F1 ATP synthase subunit epsilon n=1 Tax=Angustibacter sp. Root456 TaxID=1736539 RepID=UPI0006FA878A|nr:F0F1 ATP synthase subunit epsilon [Angustibacter sp. Root456]KQX69680.1 ATP synthase F0F1 subunit epsilon [Angustibacter sp. Root456]